MKLAFYLALVSLLSFRLQASAQVPTAPKAAGPPKDDLATMEARRAAYEAKELLAARRALNEAPFVFLGRLLTSENYKDKTGRIYEAQVWHVLHVLRGGEQIKEGTIRLNKISWLNDAQWVNNKLVPPPLVPPPPGKPKMIPRPASEDYSYPSWAINFCRLSDLPASAIPYKTSNSRTLMLHHPSSAIEPFDWYMKASHGPQPVPDHGTSYAGFGQRFKTEEEMNGFLRKQLNLVPLPQPATSYPKIKFVDARAAYLPFAPPPPPPPPPEPEVRSPYADTRGRIVKNAPVVFLGRELTGQYFTDTKRRVYRSTVLQVMQVLRGDTCLQPGTVELVERVATTDAEMRADCVTERVEIAAQQYGVYFCSLSSLPSQAQPYLTSNAPVQLNFAENKPAAAIMVPLHEQGGLISGLYRRWANEAALIDYLGKQPRLQPITKPAADYPHIQFVDKRQPLK